MPEQIIEVLRQIQELAGVVIEALSQGDAGGGQPAPAGPPPEGGAPAPA